MARQQTAATQQFVDIEEIREGTIYLKGGGLRKVLIVSGINFDLMSGEEQEFVLSGFQGFLNTIDFPIQFFIHSRKVNIDSYLERVRERKEKEKNELLQIQISEYIEFVRSFIEQNPIITKNFFVVVPYNPGISSAQKAKGGVFGAFKKISGKKTAGTEVESSEKSIQQLSYRVNEVTSGLEQIGLRVRGLGDDELLELFYNLYNPEIVEKRGAEIPHTPPNDK